jgi:hypothetical protein
MVTASSPLTGSDNRYLLAKLVRQIVDFRLHIGKRITVVMTSDDTSGYDELDPKRQILI